MLYAFLRDAKRFAQYNCSIIENAPIQIYNSALIFSPEQSIVRKQFKKHISGIYKISKGQTNWSGTLQTLEGHLGSVRCVAFSPDSKLVASSSNDRTVRLWNAATGAPHGEPLKGHLNPVNSVVFSPDGKLIASGSDGEMVRLWNVATGALHSELHSEPLSETLSEPNKSFSYWV